MRVLMISWEYPPHIVGGLGRHAAELAPALARHGIEVDLITPRLRESPDFEQPHQHLRVYRVGAAALDGRSFVEAVTETNASGVIPQVDALRAQGVRHDLIHTHDWLGARSAVELKHRYRLPLVATIHATERGRARGVIGDDHARRIEATEWDLVYQAWRAIVCSRYMVGQLAECFASPLDKIDVVPNGVRIVANPFADAQERLTFRRHYAADDEPLLLAVGRVVYEKGLHVLLDAMPSLLQAFPSARLIIAGTGSYADALEERARQHNLGEHVRLCGFISDEERDKLYCAANVTAIPSLYEPFGIVALEAMAAGCPLVAAATGGLAEVVAHGETGLLAPPGDARSLAAALVETLARPDAAAERAQRGLQEVAGAYAWERVAAQTADVYKRVYKEWRDSDWGQ
jgi:glycosyltransferase involved in cell wall biosynthesis